MHHLDRFYAAEAGLQRPEGLSIGGRPDFEGIAAWVFDVYLNARLGGMGVDRAWQRVVANIEGSEEWRTKPHRSVDRNTLYGKHLMGYQGWYGAPGDGWNNAWDHWFAGGPGRPQEAAFDLWPDVRALEPDELFPTQMTLPNGQPAKLWSSHVRKTVMRHFRWMKEAGIDGVSVGRFSIGVSNPARLDNVLGNVRAGAEATGRVFFIWYDVSGHAQDRFVQDIKNDWERLVRQVGITESPSYLKHKGRPLLGVWGIGGTPSHWADLVDFFKNHPDPACRVTLLAGSHPGWSRDPTWGPIFRSMDVISPWAVGAFGDEAGADAFAQDVIIPDIAATRSLGLDYLPVAFPGFSWHNLQQHNGGSELNVFPRQGGRFYWRQLTNIIAAGGTTLFTAMFDEADESTATMKAAPLRQMAPAQGEWLTLDADGESLSSDYYLRLGAAATEVLRGERPRSGEIPIRRY